MNKHKLIICALNGIGSFGSPVGAKPGRARYLTHTIDEAHNDSTARNAIDTIRAYGKGGPSPVAERELLRVARENNDPANVLLLAGFSYGARDIVRDVMRPLFADGVKFRRVELVTVDPDWFAGLINRRKSLMVTWPVEIEGATQNFYQDQSWPGGTPVRVEVVVEPPYTISGALGTLDRLGVNTELDCPTHRDMDTRPEVREAIREAIGRLVDACRLGESNHKGHKPT